MDTTIPPDAPKKQCKGPCGQLLPATIQYFHAQKECKHGVRNICRTCRSQIARTARLDPEIKAKEHASNRASYATHKEQKKDYQEINKDRIATYQKQYSQANSERKKQYRASRIEHFRAHGRNYHHEHREHDSKRERTYRHTTRGIAVQKAKGHRRRVRKLAIPGNLTSQQIQQKLRKQRFRCYYAACGFSKFDKRNGKYVFHLDHVIPISRMEEYPRHDDSYTVLTCPHCNLTKSDRLLSEWPQGGRLM